MPARFGLNAVEIGVVCWVQTVGCTCGIQLIGLIFIIVFFFLCNVLCVKAGPLGDTVEPIPQKLMPLGQVPVLHLRLHL